MFLDWNLQRREEIWRQDTNAAHAEPGALLFYSRQYQSIPINDQAFYRVGIDLLGPITETLPKTNILQ